MVGVPGKANGCHTCRWRRVKCDRARPSCLRCAQSGRECQGYVRSAVFLNRTAQGLQRRQYFDEAQPRSSSKQLATATKCSTLALARPLRYGDSLRSALTGYFLEAYLPSLDPSTTPLGAWVLQACTMTHPGDLLEKSLAALTITLVGYRCSDPAMVQRGQQQYGLALHGLRKAIQSPVLVLQDDTLAAVQVLKLYEFSQTTDGSAMSFDSHISAGTNLLMIRGPQRHNSSFSKAMARDIRYSAMLAGIRLRTRSPLGGAEWRTRTWRTSLDVEQSLLDRGLDISALAQDMQDLARKPDSAKKVVDAVECLARSLALAREFELWHQKAVRTGWLSGDWPYPKLDSIPPRASTPSERRATIDMDTLRQSLLMVDYWGLSLMLSILINLLRSKMPPDAPILPGPDEYGAEYQLQLSENILAVVPYQSRWEHGLDAASRCTFGLRVSLSPLHTYSSPRSQAMLERAESYIASTSRQRGLRSSEVFSRLKGEWSEG